MSGVASQTARRLARVLVVEDSEPELDLLCDTLREQGYEAVGCGSATDGLQQIHNGRFTVAVVDLRLPDLDGTRLLEMIHNVDDEVRVIIYTGAASYGSVKEAMHLGAFAYVEKLSDTSELLRHVERACQEPVARGKTSSPTATEHRMEESVRFNRELDDFASIVAHDLRSPLLTISGYSQLLEEECRDRLDENAIEYLEHIVVGVARMNRLIEGLLTYSRVGRSDTFFAQVDLESVLTQAKANLEAPIRENDAEIVAVEMPTVSGNETQLIQLFENLIGNAIKFRGEQTPLVHICCTRQENGWQFAVEDHGVGIESKHFERVFQILQQFHGKEYSGTGIGLAICWKIVERHGGRIWLESILGQGTTFRFTISDRKEVRGT